MESNPVLVADDNPTSAVSPTRRGARPKYVWSAESTTKRVCLPRNVYILARLPNDHKQPPSWVHHTENTGLAASIMDRNMSYETRKWEAKSRASRQARSSSSIWRSTQILQLLLKSCPQVDAMYWFRFLLLLLLSQPRKARFC